MKGGRPGRRAQHSLINNDRRLRSPPRRASTTTSSVHHVKHRAPERRVSAARSPALRRSRTSLAPCPAPPPHFCPRPPTSGLCPPPDYPGMDVPSRARGHGRGGEGDMIVARTHPPDRRSRTCENPFCLATTDPSVLSRTPPSHGTHAAAALAPRCARDQDAVESRYRPDVLPALLHSPALALPQLTSPHTGAIARSQRAHAAPARAAPGSRAPNDTVQLGRPRHLRARVVSSRNRRPSTHPVRLTLAPALTSHALRYHSAADSPHPGAAAYHRLRSPRIVRRATASQLASSAMPAPRTLGGTPQCTSCARLSAPPAPTPSASRRNVVQAPSAGFWCTSSPARMIAGARCMLLRRLFGADPLPVAAARKTPALFLGDDARWSLCCTHRAVSRTASRFSELLFFPLAPKSGLTRPRSHLTRSTSSSVPATSPPQVVCPTTCRLTADCVRTRQVVATHRPPVPAALPLLPDPVRRIPTRCNQESACARCVVADSPRTRNRSTVAAATRTPGSFSAALSPTCRAIPGRLVHFASPARSPLFTSSIDVAQVRTTPPVRRCQRTAVVARHARPARHPYALYRRRAREIDTRLPLPPCLSSSTSSPSSLLCPSSRLPRDGRPIESPGTREGRRARHGGYRRESEVESLSCVRAELGGASARSTPTRVAARTRRTRRASQAPTRECTDTAHALPLSIAQRRPLP
ncbi:hypothetical protein DFH06DRAFT_1470117 [Mycena polygramma]|nr:hypothetical protein DFH06DRAFT_1470117 [Mycena polygramma]